MGSLITAMLCTMEFIASDRFTGSVIPRNNTFILKTIKSVWFSSIYFLKASAVRLRANSSGSFPSGNNKTFTFIPSESNISVPRKAACCPASSPSYSNTMFEVNLRSSFIWKTESAVPLFATTFSMPHWCIDTTSV